MRTRWDIGDTLRVVRNVRNDGTWPGADTGALLVRRGSVGTVVDIGTFLQDQIIYSLHFLDTDCIVGCREEELIGADEAWAPSVFEFRQRVVAAKALAAAGKTLVPAGGAGEVLKVVQQPEGFACHVHFDCQPGRVFVVPESALSAAVPGTPAAARPERRALSHILVTINEELPGSGRPRALERIEAIRVRLAIAPGSFADEALRHSECPTAMEGGRLGRVARGQLYPELEPAAFALAVGGISGIVESPMGFHILRCEDIEAPDR